MVERLRVKIDVTLAPDFLLGRLVINGRAAPYKNNVIAKWSAGGSGRLPDRRIGASFGVAFESYRFLERARRRAGMAHLEPFCGRVWSRVRSRCLGCIDPEACWKPSSERDSEPRSEPLLRLH